MCKFLLKIFFLSSAFLSAGGEGEVIFEENVCEEECSHHCHPRIRRRTPEEEHMWQERANASWPGKRDDNLIDAFLHQ